MAESASELVTYIISKVRYHYTNTRPLVSLLILLYKHKPVKSQLLCFSTRTKSTLYRHALVKAATRIVILPEYHQVDSSKAIHGLLTWMFIPHFRLCIIHIVNTMGEDGRVLTGYGGSYWLECCYLWQLIFSNGVHVHQQSTACSLIVKYFVQPSGRFIHFLVKTN